jgi:nucleotide-binding universal stress UspA family protein
VTFTILCAVDLSPAGDEAIRQADALTKLHDGRLVAFHAMPQMSESAPFFPTDALAENNAFVALQRRVLEVLTERVRDVTGRGLDAFKVKLGSGTADSEIVKAAKRYEANLIVVGGAGPPTVARAVLGAVAERVVRYAHCPVWVAHPGAGAGPVIAATDFSAQADAALSAGVDYAKRTHGKLAVLHALSVEHVTPTGEESWAIWSLDELSRMRKESQLRLDALVSKSGVPSEALIADAAPGRAVLALAQERHARLICVGTVGRTGLGRMMLGSVAEEIVRKAHCPVLVTRQG